MSLRILPSETLGQRIARLRAQRGWTQSDLAERLAASRVAVSHFEAGLAVPSERTIVLLAGLFRFEPLELVEGTSYPLAKAERLPLVACRYTEGDLQVALLKRDLVWLRRLAVIEPAHPLIEQTLAEWRESLGRLEAATDDHKQRAQLRAALDSLL